MQQNVLKSFSAHETAVQRGKGGGSGNSKTEIFEVYKSSLAMLFEFWFPRKVGIPILCIEHFVMFSKSLWLWPT